MINRLLIANRGEIACRIIRTCKRLGIYTIAIYSDIDRHALHVKEADEAYHVGPNPSKDSYLNSDKIIAIAKKLKVDAIHPGYGFLAENAEFAQKCEAAGILFIGPPSSAILAMGSKSEAKKLMSAANVPLVPGYNGDNQDPQFLLNEAKQIGFPILIKPSAGGGGKGMRVVERAEDFESALESAMREAKSSFNDTEVLLEKYLQQARHIEIQIFADNLGNCVYLFERDCSLQRRHQKIIEEAPAVNFSNEIRQKMGEAAVRAAKAINYRGAGTVEFLYFDQQFYFMEMNTRLQVEHPVTEMICHVDLVEWQIKVTEGAPLPLTQDKIYAKGHAIEARIYAEDPYNHFIPSIGQLKQVLFPETSEHVRIDTGIAKASTISQFYDPMIAKVIVHAENRSQAIYHLRQALMETQLIGIRTNLSFLTSIVDNENFVKANIDTQFVDRELNDLLRVEKIENEIYAIAGLYLLLLQQQEKIISKIDPYSPWHLNDNWRSISPKKQLFQFKVLNAEKNCHIEIHDQFFKIMIEQDCYQVTGKLADENLTAEINNTCYKFKAFYDKETIYLNSPSQAFQIHKVNLSTVIELQTDTQLHMNSPMPGTVVAIYTEQGEKVTRGKKLIVIEAMKMEHIIHAPENGIVKALHYKVGDMVEEGVELLSFETTES